MNDLVRLNTSIVKLIEKYSEDLTRFGKLTSFQMTRDSSQRSSKFYELKQVQELESKIAYYIETRTDLTDDDKEVYYEVKKYIEQERED